MKKSLIKSAAQAIARWLSWGKAKYDSLPAEDKARLRAKAQKLTMRVLRK